MAVPRLEASKDCDMKKKLLVLLITLASTMMPNLASAVAISVDAYWCNQAGGIWDAEHSICDFDNQ
jgi:hypothetical protein